MTAVITASGLSKHYRGRAAVADVSFTVAPGRIVGLIGPKPRAEGVEDLLWSVAMLPEFQLTF